MNFFFHGASVTQQAGAASYFNLLSQQVGSSHALLRKGYGGCHFNDAGFLTLHSDVSSEIDVCVLEWNTTGQIEFDIEKLKYVAGYLLAHDILPVFLILARGDNIYEPRPCDLQVLDFCSKFNIRCLDYRNKIIPDSHLRDVVHTNEIGAKIYADNLFNDLFCNINFGRFKYEVQHGLAIGGTPLPVF